MRGLLFLGLLLASLTAAFVQPFVGVLVWTWLSIMNPHRETYGYGNFLPYAYIVAGVTVLAFLLSREPKKLRLDMISVSFIAMMIAASASTLLALSPESAVAKWDRTMKTILFCLLTMTLMTNKVRIHAFVWVLAISVGYFGIKGGVFSILTAGNYRVFGPENTYIYDNNHLALAIIMTVPLIFYLYQQSELVFVRVGALSVMLLSLAAAFFTYSRGGLLALIVMGSVLWLRSRHKFASLVLALLAVLFVFSFAPEKWFERMATISTYEEDSSALGRLRIWSAALAIFAEHPFLGGGFRVTYEPQIVDRYSPGVTARAVHNSHIEVLVELGLAGFLPHLLLIIASLGYCERIIRYAKHRADLIWARDLASSLQVAIVGYVVGGTFLSLGYYDGWYNLAILASALYGLVFSEQNRVKLG